jgi:LDH2 family malate/lactate/ureidoglycolate dehydrogenase
MTARASISVPAQDLQAVVGRLFVAAGLSAEAACTVASGLIDADLEGVPSHGVLLTDMYIDRLRHGSVSTREKGEIVSDREGAVVLDAGNAFGHLIGDQAIGLAIERAQRFAAGIVAVRHGFHFGTARRYALRAAERGCIGIVMCNTRPLMPAPGGAERVVGNNPIAISVPSEGSLPIVLDMATSEAAMGKIRLAEKAGESIPQSWAVRHDGSPTTDPKEAISGMLLPAAGHKGFGLAFMIDLMCGLLSHGASGSDVRPLYGDPGVPYDCSQLFIAIDVGHFGDASKIRAQAMNAAEKLRSGKRAPGVTRLFAPGEIEWLARQNTDGNVNLERAVADKLIELARTLNVSAEPLAAFCGKLGTKHHAET